MSILLETTNMVLTQSALLFNKSVQLSTPVSSKSAKIPKDVKRSNLRLVQAAKKLRKQLDDDRYSPEIIQKSKIRYKIHKAAHRRLVRRKKIGRLHQARHLD